MKFFFSFFLYFSLLLHSLQAQSELIASGKESSLSENRKKGIFKAFCLQMHQFIKEVLLSKPMKQTEDEFFYPLGKKDGAEILRGKH